MKGKRAISEQEQHSRELLTDIVHEFIWAKTDIERQKLYDKFRQAYRAQSEHLPYEELERFEVWMRNIRGVYGWKQKDEGNK